MLKFLASRFVKNAEDIRSQQVRRGWGTLCSIYGIFLNLLLFAAKTAAGILTGSIAVIADAVNNLSDAGSSAVTLIGFRLAGKKPDPGHPYGHGRMEYISALIVSVAIITMGIELAISSVEKIFGGSQTEFSPVSVVLLSASVLVKLYMCLYNRSIGKKIDSSAMRATAKDSLSDAFATLAVLVSLLVSHFTDLNIDGYAGAAVSLLIIYAGVSSIRETVDLLLGQSPSAELIGTVKSIVGRYPEAVGMHDIMIHDYGPGRVMISLHVEVPGDRDIFELHDVIDTIEEELKRAIGCEAVIHMDPVVTDDVAVAEIKCRVIDAVHSVDPIISIHDFRMVVGPTHSNLLFDAVIPFSFRYTDGEVSFLIKEAVAKIDPSYIALVKVEKDFASGK